MARFSVEITYDDESTEEIAVADDRGLTWTGTPRPASPALSRVKINWIEALSRYMAETGGVKVEVNLVPVEEAPPE